LDGFSEIVDVLTPNENMTGPKLAIADLFGILPIAVLHAQHAPAKSRLTASKKGRPGSRGPDGLADVVPTDQGRFPPCAEHQYLI
jgi:hypothetical protein